ncbi:hypothetical protein JW933_04125 [candidate division FCPU426 bacterium]|nr:hypothetical protein [candidate division FCPU426 bacterium]
MNYQVYHPACVETARQRLEKQENKKGEIDAPSTGLRIISWGLISLGIVVFGLALFLVGISLFSKSIPIRALMTASVPEGFDSIPGGRTFLNWMGGISLIASVLMTVLGVGLLNCVAAARYAVLSFAWLEIVLAALGWLVVWWTGAGFWDVPVMGGFLIWYFLRPQVRMQFKQVL